MTAGALHSDHVNYLIFRYLQEAGHEKAAIAFGNDWHRPPEYRDPETLPFARVVHRHELISVIQDGLLHDELVARVKKNERRFLWTNVNAGDSLERTDGGGVVVENGTAGSRPTSSSAKRKGRPPQPMRAPDEFPTPAPKRQRRSEGSEGVHLNGDRGGDGMDVDVASASADADEDGEAASPAVASEPEVIEIPERYDSMDVAVQTEVKTGPKTSTMYWKIDKRGATIFHSIWNPNPDSDSAKALLTVGEGLCRFYTVPDDAEDAKEVLSADPLSLPPNSVITASTWHPHGHTATCAVDSIRSSTDERHDSQQTILDINFDPNGIRSADYSVAPHFAAGGIVLALRYSPGGDFLLVARTNLNRGLVSIYDVSTPDATTHTPMAWCMFEHPVLDAAWHGATDFVVCGDKVLARYYRVDRSGSKNEGMLTEENFSMQGLHEMGFVVKIADVHHSQPKWDKVRCDDQSGLVALASNEGARLMLGSRFVHASGEVVRSTLCFTKVFGLSNQLTALAFQPRARGTADEDDVSVLLAAAFEDGSCSMYRYIKSDDEIDEANELLRVHLAAGPALALSWSPTGAYLAVGGIDLVQVWETRKLVSVVGESNGLLSSHDEPLVLWRPDSNALGPDTRNGEHEEEEGEQEQPLSEPSLSWSADGESLAFAVDRQIAVIRFRPPLLADPQAVEVNGHASP